MADPTLDEMMADLQAADTAGDAQLAQHIASRIKAAQGPQPMASHEAGTVVPGAVPNRAESAARGGLQGLSFGWGDEGAAGIAALIPSTDPEAAKGSTLGERYRNARDFYRGKNSAAEQANPGTYLAGQVGGAVAPTLIGAAPLTGGRALLAAGGQGAAQGAGYSDREGAGLAGDTALGTGLGLAGYGAGQVLGKGLSAASRAGGRLLRSGTARAGVQAAGEVADEVGTAAGKYGAEVQKGSRQVENLMRLEASMTPPQRALYAQLEASGVVPSLQQSVAQSTLEALPNQAATIAARQAELAALQQAAPQLATERTAKLLTPQVKEDAKSFLKAYAEPLLWAYGANKGAEALGADPETRALAAATAGVIGGRTRAGKALWTRVNRPAHQAAVGKALQRAADGNTAKAVKLLISRSAPAAITANYLDEEQQ